MWKWVAIALVGLAIFGVIHSRRKTALQLRRLDGFLRAQRIDFIRVRRDYGTSYGWPSYVVVFDSTEKSAAFRQTAVFSALVKEVQKMHEGLAGFESDRAVYVEPRSFKLL